ncbi:MULTISPECIES: diguanylate cyclase [Acidobacteriaceae]|uniref:MHYT domain-containing protein n=1 Tax=Acidobacteriaceae TaxID=204434 RepID=UPI00131C5495|nr:MULTISPECIES: diguanylate cyclase [Acidobacteriaceae]MDW5264182.1 diguanylate cyclase [Edaphobacter sp.]
MTPIATTYVYWLVGVSLCMAIIASYAAFSFAERITVSTGVRFWGWLFGGALAMGLGIWSMHYLGMLAVRLPVEVTYHIPTVLASLLLAVLASAVALWVVSRPRLRVFQIAVGGILMGAGIGGMHYLGMKAMRASAMHHYNDKLVVLSIVVAIVFSWMALGITFFLRNDHLQREWQRLGGAVLMGSGISAMHYTAMAAVTFTPGEMPWSPVGTIRVSTLGIAAVVVTTILVLFGALLTAFFDRMTYHRLQVSHHSLVEAQTALIQSESALREANLQLRSLSIRDGLTGVSNRRHFDETLETELKRAARTKLTVSLLMIDVDYFKALNDRYGHPAGDDCLRKIAGAFTARIRRPQDIVARYGGEEFAVILPGASTEYAFELAESLRLAIEQLEIPNDGSSIGPFVTVSIGIDTRRPEIGEPVTEILAAADAALYLAKTQGRNRTLCATRLGQPVEKQ